MTTKTCMRSGKCCSEMLAGVPKNEDSNLNPAYIDSLPEEEVDHYLEQHTELMEAPCKWQTRDLVTSEAICKAHERKGPDCINYPEDIMGKNQWCPVGLIYWRKRRYDDLPIPHWVDAVLISLEGRGAPDVLSDSKN